MNSLQKNMIRRNKVIQVKSSKLIKIENTQVSNLNLTTTNNQAFIKNIKGNLQLQKKHQDNNTKCLSKTDSILIKN
jgi:hypothetical protein